VTSCRTYSTAHSNILCRGTKLNEIFGTVWGDEK
jgi:hypothetical protein